MVALGLFLIREYHPLLSFLFLIFVITLAGIGPAIIANRLFKFHSLFFLSLLSTICGLFFVNLSVLTAGHLGMQVSGPTLVGIFAVCITISITILVVTLMARRVSLSLPQILRSQRFSKLLFEGFSAADALALFVFFVFYGYMFMINMKYYFPYWDNFTYWLLDAKIIYTTGLLRQNLDVISTNNYSSYYPLHAVYVYNLFGEIVEQFASFFTTFYGLLATLVAYTITRGQNNMKKIVVASALLIINLVVAQNQGTPFTFYSEMIIAFVTVFYFLVLSQNPDIQTYPLRLFFIILLSILFTFIKDVYIYYTILSLILWLIRDFNFIRRNFRKIILHRGNLLVLSAFALMFIPRAVYTSAVHAIGRAGSITPKAIQINIYLIWEYLKEITSYVVANYYPVLGTIVAGITVFITSKQKTTSQKVILLGIFAFPGLIFSYYVLTRFELQSQSILRYVTISLFAIPFLFSFSDLIRPTISKWWNAMVAFVPVTIILYSILTLRFLFPLDIADHSGRYSDFTLQKPYYELSERTKAFIGDENILVSYAPYQDKNLLANTTIPVLFTEYYLAENATGGQFSKTAAAMVEFARTTGTKYVLVTNPNSLINDFFGLETDNKLDFIVEIRTGDSNYQIMFL